MYNIQDNDDENIENNQNNSEPLDEKISVWEQFGYALTRPKKYIDLVGLRLRKQVKYVTLLLILVSIITFAVPVAATIAGFGGFNKLFTKSLPEFTVQDGKLVSEDKFDIVISGLHFYIDTASESVPDEELFDNTVYMALGSKIMRLVAVTSGKTTDVMSMDISSMLPEGFDNEMLAELTPYFYVTLFIYFVFTVLQLAVKYLVLAFVYMIFAWALNKNTGLMLSKKQIFMLCFYAQTLGIVLVNINAALGYKIPTLIMSIIGVFITFQYISKVFGPYVRDKMED